MGNDGAAVAFRADKVDSRAGQLHAVGNGLFMDMKSVIAFAAERWDQCRVDIHDGIGVRIHQLLGKDDHAACQNHQVDPQILQHFHQRHSHGPVRIKFLSRQHKALDTGILCPFHSIGTCLGGNDGNDLTAAQFSPVLGIDQCL